jgi:nucleoside-diphosphate-sugar epimerase
MAAKVLVTGVTGAVGSSVVEGLVRHGHEVTCPVRNISKAQSFAEKHGSQVVLVELDSSLAPKEQFRNVSRGFDRIIHTGFANSAQEKDYETEVLLGLLESAKETSETKPTGLIFTTGCLILGEQAELSNEENTSSQNSLPLVSWRIEHEEIALNANSENLHVSVIRPGWIYGGSGVDFWFRSCKTHGKIVVPVAEGRVSYIHKEDLGEIYALVIENFGTGVFIATEGLGPSYEETIELAKSVTGVQEVEKVQNIWEHIKDYGFFLFGLSNTQKLEAKRARDLYGFAPKHNIKAEASQLLILD